MRNDGVTAGALMERIFDGGKGEWHVVEWIDGDEPISASDSCTLYGHKLLCPAAPDIATALAELAKLPGAWMSQTDTSTAEGEPLVFRYLTMKLEVTTLDITAEDGNPYIEVRASLSDADAETDTYEARTRDLQREGAIRQYLQHAASQRPDDASGPGVTK